MDYLSVNCGISSLLSGDTMEETVLPFSVLRPGCVWCRDMVLYFVNILS